MASITEPKADLAELAERPRSVAQVLRSFPADHPRPSEELDALSEEIRVVVAQLRAK